MSINDSANPINRRQVGRRKEQSAQRSSKTRQEGATTFSVVEGARSLVAAESRQRPAGHVLVHRETRLEGRGRAAARHHHQHLRSRVLERRSRGRRRRQRLHFDDLGDQSGRRDGLVVREMNTGGDPVRHGQVVIRRGRIGAVLVLNAHHDVARDRLVLLDASAELKLALLRGCRLLRCGRGCSRVRCGRRR